MEKNIQSLKVLLLCFFALQYSQITAQVESNPFEGLENLVNSYKVVENEKDTETGDKFLSISCIRQKGNRDFPYPIKGHKIIANPPVLTWPMEDYRYPDTFPFTPEYRELSSMTKYKVQLSRTKDFSKNTHTSEDLHLAFYNPHQKLEQGKWFWRYAIIKNGKIENWSATYDFVIEKETPNFQSLSANVAYQKIVNKHPRILKPISIKKTTSDQEILLKLIKKSAERAFNKQVTSYKIKGKEIPKNATPQEINQIKRFLLKGEILAISKSIEDLLTIYRINGEDRYADKAIDLGDFLIQLGDPIETYHTTDFGGASAMKSLSKIYDVCYGKLSKNKRRTYEDYIGPLLSQILNHAISLNVGSSDGILFAHFFQHTFYDAFVASIVMKNHLPNAETAFKLLYDIWLARTPGGGFLEDGTWPNGNIGYIHTNMKSMVDMYLLYKQLFNINLFLHPWYKNCSSSLAFTVPPNSWGDGFCDGAEKEKLNAYRGPFAYILGQELDNAFALDYAYAVTGQHRNNEFAFKKDYFKAYRLQHTPKKMKAFNPDKVPQALVFPQSGTAVMHTNVMNSDKNLFVSFRSSPFGVGSHGHAEHNSFNIIYKGKPVFYPTGYRITTQDKHFLLSQKHGRAKNTFLVDGKTQGFAYDSYGWIPRFLHGKDISYVMGDASNAYKEMPYSSINWITVLKNIDAYTPEEGFIISEEDNPKVKLFRRHVAILRPNIVVIYDELESEKPVTWTLQLNGKERSNFLLNAQNNTLTGNLEDCEVHTSVFASSKLQNQFSDTNYVIPFDWLNPQRGRPSITFEKNQYHTAFQNKDKQNKMRFLTIITLDDKGAKKTKMLVNSLGNYTLGNYVISAEMNKGKPARLKITNKSATAYLLYGPTMKSEKAKERKFSNSTILIEKGLDFQESIDKFPLMVPLNYK